MVKEEIFPMRFFVATFLWSWLIWTPLVLASFGFIRIDHIILKNITTPITIIAAFGPAFGALISLKTINKKGEVKKYLKTYLDLKFGWKVWIIPTIILLLSTIIAWYIPEIFGEKRLPMLLPNILNFPMYWLIMVLFGGGQEEIGWRGYILPYLENKYGIIKGSIVLSVIWALWHIPLWFITNSSQTYMNLFGFMMLTFGYSFLFSWGIKKANNKPLAGMIMHGTANSIIVLFPTIIMVKDTRQIRFWIWVSATFLIGVIYIFVLNYKRNDIKDKNYKIFV